MEGANFYRAVLKPAVSITAALILFLLSLPLQLLIFVWLYFHNKGNVFFTQVRIGYKEKPFRIYKFKTMADIYNNAGNLLPDNERQTRWGNFLRRYHLDELPQVFNILSGDLHLIGPRPLLPEYLPYYTAAQRLRHNCHPGLIGLSQVKGGNALSWKNRLRYDNFYARNCSLNLDIYIVVKFVRYIIRKRSALSSTFSESFIDYYKRSNVRSNTANLKNTIG